MKADRRVEEYITYFDRYIFYRDVELHYVQITAELLLVLKFYGGTS